MAERAIYRLKRKSPDVGERYLRITQEGEEEWMQAPESATRMTLPEAFAIAKIYQNDSGAVGVHYRPKRFDA